MKYHHPIVPFRSRGFFNLQPRSRHASLSLTSSLTLLVHSTLVCAAPPERSRRVASALGLRSCRVKSRDSLRALRGCACGAVPLQYGFRFAPRASRRAGAGGLLRLGLAGAGTSLGGFRPFRFCYVLFVFRRWLLRFALASFFCAAAGRFCCLSRPLRLSRSSRRWLLGGGGFCRSLFRSLRFRACRSSLPLV